MVVVRAYVAKMWVSGVFLSGGRLRVYFQYYHTCPAFVPTIIVGKKMFTNKRGCCGCLMKE